MKKKLPSPSPPGSVGRFKRSLCLLAVLVLVLITAWGTDSLSEVPIHLAKRAVSRHEEADARRWLSVAKSLSSTNPAIELLLARIERRNGRFEKVEEHLGIAKSLEANDVAIAREAMLLAVDIGQLEEIEEPLMSWLAEADAADRREICATYSNALAREARFDDAKRLLEAWRADFPDDPEPEYRLGRILEHLRRTRDAGERYRAALERDPSYHPAIYSLARLSLQNRKVEEALALYERCSRLPHSAAAKVGMGNCLKSLGKIEEARRLFREAALEKEEFRVASYEAVKEPADRFLAATELGKLESESGNYKEAEYWLRRAVEYNPRDSVARYAWAVSLRGLGNKKEAEEQFALARSAREALDLAGKLHDQIDRKPDDVEARYELGTIILKYDSERTGLYWLNTALHFDPHHLPTHQALADYFEEKGDESPEYLRRADYHRAKIASASKATSDEQTY